MNNKLLLDIRASVAKHIYHLEPCARLIEQYGMHFFNRKALARWKEVRVNRSLLHMWIPAVITLLFGLRALVFILFPQWFDTPIKRLALFSEMLPENGRHSFEVTVMLWSFMHVFYVTYVVRGRLTKFAVLAILKVHPLGCIKPTNLGLTPKEYKLFTRFRNLTRNICDSICMGYPFITTPSVALQAIFINSVLQINVSITIFWIAYLYIWVFYICSAAYGLPIFISVVARYIQVKQTSVLESMVQLSSKLCKYRVKTKKRQTLKLNHFRSIWYRMIRLQRRYGNMQSELLHYTGLVARCLNIIFGLYIAMICYITYILFLTETSAQFQLLYSQIYAINILLLTLLIMRCSTFTRHSPRMRLLVIRFYMQSAKRSLLGAKDLLQADQIAENLRRKNGFKLVNGFRIDTNAYFGVIIFWLAASFINKLLLSF